MKKIIVIMIAAALLVSSLTACSNNTETESENVLKDSQTTSVESEKANNEEEILDTEEVESQTDIGTYSMTETTLETGEKIQIYDFGNLKIHAVATGDLLGDEYYIVESESSLVGIEMPSFTTNLDSWKSYIENIGKPMKDVFISNHATGASYVGGMKIYGTQGAAEAISTGSTYNTTQSLAETFGTDFHGGEDIIHITDIIESDDVKVGGIDFDIVDEGDSYSIVIPEANVIYTHMLGKSTHSILASIDHIDAMTATLKGYQETGYQLILSSHSAPEGQDAVAAKIDYLAKVKELANSCTTKEEFIEKMNEEYPDYAGANYLEMTAGFLYQ